LLNYIVITLGVVTGNDSGIYPDNVLKHGWFTNARTGKIELYNHTGTPLTGKKFTIRLLGSRKDLIEPRTSLYTANGASGTLDVDDNIDRFVEFTGVALVNDVITITVTNTTPSDTNYAYLNAIEIEEEVEKIHLKLNLGGQGTAPTVPEGWRNVWGLPYVDADLTADVDFGDVGNGIGLRCINNGSPDAWGENNNTAAHDLGEVTGTNAGIYPDNVLKHGWFTNNRTGKVELYNRTGTPLSGRTFTVRMLGSRKDLTEPRTSVYTIHGTSISQDVDDNISNVAVFSGVSLVNGVITITVTNGTPSDTTYAYLNAIEIEEESEQPVRDISSVTNPSAKTVPFGTAFENLDLPSQVTVTLDDQSSSQIDVEWLAGNYDPQTAGTYALTGNLVNLPAGITNSQNLTASINVTVEAQAGNINVKLNLGGRGTAPSVAGWKNVWGQPYVDSNLTADVDFGDVGNGIGLRCINNGAPDAWGENNDTAVHDLGEVTGNNSGRYPDNVLKHGWFTNGRIGKIELYNHTGTPLSEKTFTILLLGSRKDLTQPRTSLYTVNGISKTLDVDDNINNVAEFTKVGLVNNVITITTTNGTPSDTVFAYLNSIEIIQEGSLGPSPSKLYFDTFSSGGTIRPVLVYLPPGYKAENQYPLIFFYHGEGGKGTNAIVNDQFVGTGDGVATQFGGSFASSGRNRVLYSSVLIKLDGVEVAWGKANGKIEGLGVSGTMSHQTANGSFNIVFDEAPVAASTITITYEKSQIFETALPEFLNRGDEPPGVIILCPQIIKTDFSPIDDFDDLKTYAQSKFTFDSDRISLTGVSRGGRGCRIVLQARYMQIASVVALATPDYSGFTWTNYSNIGTMWIMGTADTYGNESYNILSGAGSETLNIYPRTRNFWAGGHTASIWNTQCYNRKERTDAKGTADFDFVRWLKKHSINLSKRASLFVEFAEFTKLIEDYREALIQVNMMAAGSTKDTLLTRLSKLKTSIDNGGRRFLLDLGISTQTTTGYNNSTNHASGQSISNLVDDTGSSSTFGFAVVTESVGTNQQASIQSNRGNATYFGFARTANQDGCVLGSGTGTYKFTGLNTSKKYNLRFHHNEGSADFNARAEISIKIGSTSKTQYSAGNTLKYVEFLNISPSIAGEIVFEGKRAFDRDLFLTVIELFETA
jgi:hypothetical protein